MATWYGWLALAASIGLACHDGVMLVANAWRGKVQSAASAVAWFAIWATIAIALWVSP